MLTDEIQLGFALEAFSWAHKKPQGWATQKLTYFRSAGITSMGDLRAGCKDMTVNLDLELFGIPAEERLKDSTIQYLASFLPGPVGQRAFRLAQRCAEKVKKGSADTEYVHRPESGKKGKEEFHIPVGDDWTLNVDCAGFVRSTLKHVCKNPFVLLISDRDFMRAKDFFGFFQTIPYTVMDREEIPESDKRMKWRIVPDLRMVIPGDVICYRPQGSAAGGAAFTENDRKDLHSLLKAVRMAQIWVETMRIEALNTRNVARDPTLKPWVEAVHAKLKAIGIKTVKELRRNLDTINDKLKEGDFTALKKDTLRLMKECMTTTALNTGHIVFAAGPAVHKGDHMYRIRVVHSTKFGKLDANGEVTTGVQEHFRRFMLVDEPDGTVCWKRTVAWAKPIEGGAASDDEEDNPNDDMEEEPEEYETEAEESEHAEEAPPAPLLADVIAARMCF